MPENKVNSIAEEVHLRHVFVHLTDTFKCVAFSPNGKWIASGSHDQTVRVWEIETGQCVQVYESPHLSHSFLDLAFCPVGPIAKSFGYTKLEDPDILAGTMKIEAGRRKATREMFTYGRLRQKG